MKQITTSRPRFRPELELLEDRTTPTIVTPFTPRFSTNDTGEISLIGNTLETASTVGNPGRTAQDVLDARNGVGANINNNNWNMAFVDVDNDPTTFNSSQANLTLPLGATVLFAGLYWGSVTTTPAQTQTRNQVLFDTPATNGYTTLTGTLTGSFNFTGTPPGNIYQGFADVTSLVQAARSGTYTVANVQATTETGSYAGWSLVVVLRVPGDHARNLTVFDGFAVQASTDPPLNIPISGFIAPPSGPVNSNVGIVSYEGDLGTTGDSMALNSTKLSSAVNPVNNFFNSSIANDGVRRSAKAPNFTNQLGFDIANVQVPAGVIKNGATSATITLSTSGDGYFPGVVTFATDLFSPTINVTKSFTDLNGGKQQPGDTIEYDVTLSNTGQDAASNLFFTDEIPPNTTYVPGSLQVASGANAGAKTDAAGDDQAEFDAGGNQVVYRLGTGANATSGGTLAIGASTTIRFMVTVNPGTPDATIISNQGTAEFSGATTGFLLDSDSNEVDFPINAPADLAITKTVDNPTPNVGDTVTFTVNLSNNGPFTATGVAAKDQLPPGLTFVSATPSQGSYDNTTGIWTVGTVANGATATLTIQATVTSPAPETNKAAVSASDVPDPNPNNNSDTAVVTPQKADLQVTKTVDNPRPNVGDTVTFTVLLDNNGPDDATNVQISDFLPAGMSFVGATPSQGAYDSTTGTWTVGTLANGDTAQLTIQATVTDASVQTNVAEVSASDVFDPNPNNNADTAVVTPRSADLVLTKQVNNPTPNVGDNITYTLTLTNKGPNKANNVQVADSLPAGLTFVSATPSQGTYDSTSGIWIVGSLANGATATLRIRASVVSPTPETNTGTASATEFDPDLTNNTDTADITPQRADLAISKSVSNATPNVGDILTYNITLINLGPDDATGVTVQDSLPTGVTFISANPSQGTYKPGTGVWNVGALDIGDTATLVIRVRVASANPETNTASISGADQFDPNTGNNDSSAVVTPPVVDLALTKTPSDLTPNVGDTITYTLTLSNNGPDTATGGVVSDPLPAGLTLLDATPSQGTFDPTTGVWDFGSLASGASATLTLTVRVDSPASKTNTATASSDQFDSNPTNNTATATITPQQADLALTKTVNNTNPNVGDVVTFTITLNNLGSDTATNVTVEDQLPPGLTFQGATPSEGAYDSGTGTWTVGTVPVGATPTLLIQATVTTTRPQINSASVTADQFDPNLLNNKDTAALSPTRADLEVTKVASVHQVVVGQQVTYTITVRNLGPNAATNVVVTDKLPAGESFVSSQPSQGTYSPGTGQWSVGTLASGGFATLRITVRVNAARTIRNTVTVTSPVFDPDLSNNIAAEVILGIRPIVSKRLLLGSSFL